MAALIVPSRLTRQPQAPAVVAVPGCQVAYLGSLGRDIQRNVCAPQVTSVLPMDRVYSTNGVGFECSTGSQAGPQFERAYTLAAGADFTIIASFVKTNFTGSNYGIWREGASAGGSTFFIFQPSGFPLVRINGTTVISPGSGDTFPNATVGITAACRIRSSVSADVWWSGKQRHTATHAIATVTSLISQIQINTGAGQSAGALACFLAFNRALSDAELALYTVSPWAMFQSTKVTRYALPAAAAPAGGFFGRYYYDMGLTSV